MAAAPVVSDDRLTEIIGAALEADARHEPADSLYAPGAVIVADGETRYEPPRYAGIGSGGAVAVTSSRLEVRGSVAWGQVEYRWLSNREAVAREARATFVLIPNDKGAWQIRHAHSSSPDKHN
jgi:hypothetical protein